MYRHLTLNILTTLSFVLPLSAGATPVCAQSRVEFQSKEPGQLDIRIDGQPFATLNYSPEFPKPFLLPVRTASGTIINRALNDASDADHVHHKGLWISIDEVNEQKHWAEKAPIVNVSVRHHQGQDGAAVLDTVNEWRGSENQQVIVTESTQITIHPNRLLVYDIRFTTKLDEVEFGDTKEGLLGFRVAPSMKEKNGGQIVACDGTKGSRDCWGRAFPWIDYVGTVDGKTAGVTLMDHPGNFRPSRYHVRDYGLFSISPFGESAYTNGREEAKPFHLKKGETLRLRYGVYLHDGGTAEAAVEQAYQQFLKSAD